MEKKLNIDELSVAAIRSTCIDGINLAKSGHPGAALGLAPILYTLYNKFIVANPFKPYWQNRDRVVLSCGHASMLLYTILHLCGYNISIEDLQKFRKLNSITPGHPEFKITEGVDASSGPLGMGIAQAVGLAIAETMLAERYSKRLFKHYTYCVVGDGCLEEGISQEAITYAGLNKLNKLIMLYDSNDITLDGPLANSNIEDVQLRFEAAGWDIITVKDGNNLKEIEKAISKARTSSEKPTLIIFKTIIGFGSINQGTHKVHGAPLGTEDGERAKESYGYTYPPFEIPEAVYDNFKNNFVARNNEKYAKYNTILDDYKKNNPQKAQDLEDFQDNDVSLKIKDFKFDKSLLKGEATRISSEMLLNFYHENLPILVGGSADVAASVKTNLKDGIDYGPKTRNGTNMNWGVREFFMCAASNGILLHGGLRTYCGSFLVFSDYAKSALRMAALTELPQIFLLSHDTLAVGEDGPTHQPIEHFPMLRSIPNFNMIRPCDGRETLAAYKIALNSTKTPTAIILSRQNLPLIENSSDFEEVNKGAYIVSKSTKEVPDITIIATGSEVFLATEVKEELKAQGIDAEIVSMPSFFLFENQSENYKKSVLRAPYEKTFSVEMASTFGWAKYAKFNFGIDEFGRSARDIDVMNYFGFNKSTVKGFILNKLEGK